MFRRHVSGPSLAARDWYTSGKDSKAESGKVMRSSQIALSLCRGWGQVANPTPWGRGTNAPPGSTLHPAFFRGRGSVECEEVRPSGPAGRTARAAYGPPAAPGRPSMCLETVMGMWLHTGTNGGSQHLPDPVVGIIALCKESPTNGAKVRAHALLNRISSSRHRLKERLAVRAGARLHLQQHDLGQRQPAPHLEPRRLELRGSLGFKGTRVAPQGPHTKAAGKGAIALLHHVQLSGVHDLQGGLRDEAARRNGLAELVRPDRNRIWGGAQQLTLLSSWQRLFWALALSNSVCASNSVSKLPPGPWT